MNSYAYLLKMFRAVLTHSLAIGGRVFYAPYWANELNSSNLEQLIEGATGEAKTKKYPLALIMPPTAQGRDWNITMLFLTQTGITSAGHIRNLEPATNRSLHSVADDWQEMKSAADDFLATLKLLIRDKGLGGPFSLTSEVPVITPVSTIGDDRVSGVIVRFPVLLQAACEVSDYPADAVTLINLPEL
jgi:hypothetical protein